MYLTSLSSPLSPTVSLSAVPVGVITGTPCLTASAIKPSVAPEVTAPTTTSTSFEIKLMVKKEESIGVFKSIA